MFKTTQELQDFLLWCRDAKIEAVKVGEMEVRFSALAFVPDFEDITAPKPEANIPMDPAHAAEANLAAENSEDQEALFWSSNG